jgi:cell division protein ZapA (FtsZ GTPase activity inhibitor)
MYAVLRHLIDTVYDLLNQPQNEAYEAKIMVRAIVTFAFQLFIKLFTTVLTRLKFKAADLVPRRVRVNTRILANVPQVRVNGASDGLGKMVLSALVVKRRLEDELSHVQNTILQGSQLVEVLVNSMGKSNAMAGVHNQEVLNTLNVLSEMQTSEAYIGSSKAVVNNIVNAATKLHVVDRKARNVNSKALVKQIVNQAKTLQEKLTGVSTKARFVSVPTELRDQVSLLVLHAQLLQ